MAKIGRPSIYSEELVNEFFRRVMFGDDGLGRLIYQVCADPDMPGQDTVYRWRRERPGFNDAFNAVREMKGERYIEQLETIAKEMLETEIYVDEFQKAHRVPKHDPRAAAVAVNAIAQAARLNQPRERQIKHTGPDGGPVQVENAAPRIDVSKMSPTAREYLKAALLEMQRHREQEQS